MDSGDEFFFEHFFCSSDESSDDEELVMATLIVNNHIENQQPLFRGSIVGHEPALNRNRVTGHMLLWDDYFKVPKPLFGPKHFRRRFRMAKHVFNRIREGVVEYDDYFRCKKDALGNVGFSSYQKCTVAI